MEADEILEGSPEGRAPLEAIPLVPAPPPSTQERGSFSDYQVDARVWITLVTGEYYPDILVHACQLYEPVLRTFAEILHSSESSTRLLLSIAEHKNQWMRVQTARVFRKYVSPETPVEMLKIKRKALQIAEEFGDTFRPIHLVQAAFDARPIPDEPLCAILWEYKDRGKKGYDLTSRFFEMFRQLHPDLDIIGPERAGRDVFLGEVFADYPNPKRPVDFVIRDMSGVLAIGLARYDGDRGGAQEDDRTGGYKNCADEVLAYCVSKGLDKVKVVFLNDGPGLLLGTMWRDYASLETRAQGKVKVVTLRMLEQRLTQDWIRS